jgi:uracil-DNA glycosylase
LGFGLSQRFSTGRRNQNWAELRADVKNCQFTKCKRNKNKLPLFFDRKEDTISKIRFIILSQEPGASLGQRFDNPKEMEDDLIKECREQKGVVPKRIGEIFAKGFDPSADEIYWTHSLKCVPTNDKDIKNEWEPCAEFCKDYFMKEIQLIPSEPLVLIPLGNYALALCRHLLEGRPLSNVGGITEYMQAHASPDLKEPFNFNGKRLLVFPFIHPSHREELLKRYEGLAEIEKRLAEKIRKMNH